MKKLVILGSGAAGTTMANKLSNILDDKEWQITIVDKSLEHHYQPGYLFIPFGMYTPKDVIRPKKNYLNRQVKFMLDGIKAVDAEANKVELESGQKLDYDYLIIATGCEIRPDEVHGMTDSKGWHKNVFDFYTIEGAVRLGKFLKSWKGGRLVINIAEMPIKCPISPLEFSFLSDWYFSDKGLRDKVQIEYVTPLSGAFTKKVASQQLGSFMEEKGINITTDFNIGEVNHEKQQIISYNKRTVDYDLLVTIPPNFGAEYIDDSGLGDESNFIPTDPKTLRSKEYDNIFVIGDTTNIPASKAASVAHFASETLTKNFLNIIDGHEPEDEFDGHANCYIESGHGKGLLIDFNYTVEPLPGHFPLPGIGPFWLLRESKANHWGKMMYRWIYFNMLLKGIDLPIPAKMMMAGKKALHQLDHIA